MSSPVSAVPETTSPADRAVLRWLVLATFTVILNETIMLNAIPRLMEEFDVPATDAQWLSTAFMLTMAVVIPITGWFLQRVTTRTAFATAMGIFCTGTLLAACAWAFPVLIVARVIQAAGTAVMMPLLMTTLMTVVPVNERGKTMGNVTLAISVAPALGPTVSGVILQGLSWRWIFILVLPFAMLVSFFALRKLTNVGERVISSIDWLSVGLSVVGFGSIVYGLSTFGEGAKTAIVDPWISTAIGVAGVTAFVLRQLQLQRGGTPLLDLRTLNVRLYTISLGLMAAAFMAMLGLMILLPLYLQDVRGESTLMTGLLLMPGGLAMGVLGPTVGKLFDNYGARVLVVPGAAVIVGVLIGFSQLQTTTPIGAILALHVLLSLGLAFVFTPVFTVGLGALPMNLYSHGSSLLGTGQQLSAAAGTALVVTIMSSKASSLVDGGTAQAAATTAGMRSAFAVAAGISVLILVLAFFIPGKGEGPSAHPEAADEHGEHGDAMPALDPVLS